MNKKKFIKFASKVPTWFYAGSSVAAIFGGACLLKEYMGGPKYRKDIDAKDKVAIVTGANTGIGKETAWELARRGARVYMACRDMKKCEEARKQIVMSTANKYVYCRPCDLASIESIKRFVDIFKAEQMELHILINNAGVMRPPRSKTTEGFELQLGVNHLGHFLLTNLLLDYLKNSAPSRIVTLSSTAHLKGKINTKDLNSDLKYNPTSAYNQSKLANILFTRELAKQLQGTGVTANAVHPGIVDTELIRHMSFFTSYVGKIFVYPFVWPFIKNPTQGCQTVIYAALDPELETVTGQYFSNFELGKTSALTDDEELAKWLWAVSAKWTRLDELVFH